MQSNRHTPHETVQDTSGVSWRELGPFPPKRYFIAVTGYICPHPFYLSFLSYHATFAIFFMLPMLSCCCFSHMNVDS